MGTTKPRIQTILEHETHKKFKTLCQIEGRTESNLAAKIITDYIKTYENVHGEINVPKNDTMSSI